MSTGLVQTGAPNTPAAPQSQAESAGALGGGGGAGEVQDWGEALARQEAALNQTGELVTRQGQIIESLRAELANRDQKWANLGRAITGEPEVKPTPVQARGNRLSALTSLLKRDAQESLRQGFNGMPHTVKIGEELAAYAQESDAEKEALAAQVKELKERLDRQQNPLFQGLERAGHQMEGMVEEALETLYGSAKETAQIRAAQYDAITNLINNEIKDIIKSNDRAALLKIQRSPKAQRAMANHFTKMVLPPKVLEMMEAEELANQPDDPGELLATLNEAKQKFNAALAADDNRQADFWSQQMDEIRQKFLAAQYGGKRGGAQSGKPSINSLVTNYLGGQARR